MQLVFISQYGNNIVATQSLDKISMLQLLVQIADEN